MTTPYEIIKKKRDGLPLADTEIEWFIRGFVSRDIPDYQMTAFLMAVYFQGMDRRECLALTRAMTASGDVMDLSRLGGFTVDKHSTGGVGDKTTLVLAPLVAACGCIVPKMTGRELGHTGGTVDKLESIPGLLMELTPEKFVETARTVGFGLLAQTDRVAPADKHIYALRNVTATVEAVPLIAASIMSKKLAAGADGIVLDVKTGNGSFMPTHGAARELARTMVDIGTRAGKEMVAVITGMDQPLGFAIGNAIEVEEAIATLDGRGPEDLVALVLELGSHMVKMAGRAKTLGAARRILEQKLADREGLKKLAAFIQAQGGDPSVIENPARLPQPETVVAIPAARSGYVQHMDTLAVGLAAKVLGAGRRTRDDVIDHAVGIELKKKVGDPVGAGETLAVCHSDGDPEKIESAREKLLAAYTIGDAPAKTPRLFYERISDRGIEEMALS